jgi:hypothetical protein
MARSFPQSVRILGSGCIFPLQNKLVARTFAAVLVS